ncbi:MAG: proliferating cell nuclear antigen (pcna) [Candidatus Nitrosotenuis sp.]
MLKTVIKNVGEWKAVINAIGDIVEDAMFICNSDGITFRGMDASHIALLDVTFPKESFESFEAKTSFFGLRVEEFKKVLNTSGNADTVTFQISENDRLKVLISGSLNMEYNIRLIEKTEVNTPLPKIDYKSKISLDPNTLARILSNIQQISEYVTISSEANKIRFLGTGEAGDATIGLEKGSPELEKLDVLEETSAIYSLEYMAQIIRDVGKASKRVNMEYASKNPIHILFEMPSMAKVEYYLAPRVED